MRPGVRDGKARASPLAFCTLRHPCRLVVRARAASRHHAACSCSPIDLERQKQLHSPLAPGTEAAASAAASHADAAAGRRELQLTLCGGRARAPRGAGAAAHHVEKTRARARRAGAAAAHARPALRRKQRWAQPAPRSRVRHGSAQRAAAAGASPPLGPPQRQLCRDYAVRSTSFFLLAPIFYSQAVPPSASCRWTCRCRERLARAFSVLPRPASAA